VKEANMFHNYETEKITRKASDVAENLQFKGSIKEPNISIYFFFPPIITQWCSISNVLFTGRRGVSDFSVLKYYYLNINYSLSILSECLCILIDCSQLSKTYYNMFSSSTRDRHVQCIYWWTFRE